MKVKRIKISDEDDVLLELIKQKEKLTNEELFSKMIHHFADSANREIDKYILEILEYVKLLVKCNTNLPSSNEPEKMKKIVMSESRFSNYIKEKKMMRRSFRVSESFSRDLRNIQEQAKSDGILKTQEQILNDMMEIYKLYLNQEINLIVDDEIEKQLLNVMNIYLTKQAQFQNALLENIEQKFENIEYQLSKVAK